ncbi:hypothetical protein DFH11DRAFT_278420 [Phellopilus nigrolimitatus]|nr:hypothetical protein DFH11DRAFT_278420 [Phellopilus nigrolimitatus]
MALRHRTRRRVFDFTLRLLRGALGRLPPEVPSLCDWLAGPAYACIDRCTRWTKNGGRCAPPINTPLLRLARSPAPAVGPQQPVETSRTRARHLVLNILKRRTQVSEAICTCMIIWRSISVFTRSRIHYTSTYIYICARTSRCFQSSCMRRSFRVFAVPHDQGSGDSTYDRHTQCHIIPKNRDPNGSTGGQGQRPHKSSRPTPSLARSLAPRRAPGAIPTCPYVHMSMYARPSALAAPKRGHAPGPWGAPPENGPAKMEGHDAR